jgi:hypothetical protein
LKRRECIRRNWEQSFAIVIREETKGDSALGYNDT